MKNTDSLNIMQLNARSMIFDKLNLVKALHNCELDVILISEFWFTKQELSFLRLSDCL